ncbi:hypothetical protein LVY72_11735 [Arthrobacter sp. I2-34]|uniref:Styrene monooxygenase StyA putative substrate binding domain-containing protein n=1 Tax=Arthrobacter hankyongi TaxID=2904801 RepID=A0ABS9L7H9_9MICC|nr:styrene monooxygenase/indole monooxygenase family protein [Arthrobacter hankyongi]MCG2622581.1 hypothetical protein [Arthrobacter hankyongi]
MREISIIGAGHSGTLLAVGLAKAGHKVSLYSDKDAEGIRDTTSPTGTAAIFADSLAVERRLGARDYQSETNPIDGIHVFFSPRIGQEFINFGTTLGSDTAGAAVDVRLRSYDRMVQLEELGAEVTIGTVDMDGLERIAAGSELTVVATGKGGLSGLFPRDPQRSVFTAPQRKLAMILVRGIPTDGSAFSNRIPGHTPVCFNLFGNAGEIFWVPFLHKDGEKVWCLVFEARPGGPFDRWDGVNDLAGAFATATSLVKEFTPWDWPAMQYMEPLANDPFSWLKGAFAPSVRAGSGLTPGGHAVMSLGDTTVSYDPICGQGAGSGVRQAGHIYDAIMASGDGPLDRAWMEETQEAFYRSHIDPTYRFTNTFLEPPAAAVRILTAAYADQRVAGQLLKTFNRPPEAFPMLADAAAGSDWIRRCTGQSGGSVVAKGKLKVLAAMARNAVKGQNFNRAQAVEPARDLADSTS